MKRKFVVTGAVLVSLSLAACGGSNSSRDENIDSNRATAECGLLVGLANGNMPINVDTYEDVTDTLEMLAEDGEGEARDMAAFILAGVNGEEQSDAEAEEVTEEFKEFCMDYTVD